jgi:hypothetical protein
MRTKLLNYFLFIWCVITILFVILLNGAALCVFAVCSVIILLLSDYLLYLKRYPEHEQ